MFLVRKDYVITGTFESDDFSITVPVDVLRAVTEEEAETLGYAMDFGNIYYIAKTRQLHYHDGKKLGTFINQDGRKELVTGNAVFDVFHPRKDFKHELFMGLPIHEQEDYKRLPFSEWESKLFAYCEEMQREKIVFESLAYSWEPVIASV